MSGGSRNRATAATVAVGAVVVSTTAASWWMYQSIQRYGWKGTLRLIWEGDPYSPEIREAIDKLDGAERSMEKKEKILAALETSFQRASLDAVDDDGIVVTEWIVAYTTATGQDLYKDLVRIDNDLDKLAASVDSVLSSSVDIKKRKKLLSKQIVGMMERADNLLQCYSEQQDSADVR